MPCHVAALKARGIPCTRCHRRVLQVFMQSLLGTSSFHTASLDPTFRAERRTLKSADCNDRRWFSSAVAKCDPPSELIDSERAARSRDAATYKPGQWYLQLQDNAPNDPSLLKRQEIPKTPPDAPSILQPLLKHLSTDIGLDDLALLDLRNLDPPPALGTNLTMIVGTARSEKHLMVSADRLCRWLRTEHKLTPHADGLLGRNELKLKMRRKARRTKMLNAFNAIDLRDSDDGIKTGWVCVSVGNIEANFQAHTNDEDQAFIGFESEPPAGNLVIQIMTEEKRAEIDLENLWSGILGRSVKNQAKHQPPADTEASLGLHSASMGVNLGRSNTNNVLTSHSKGATRSYHSTAPSSALNQDKDDVATQFGLAPYSTAEALISSLRDRSGINQNYLADLAPENENDIDERLTILVHELSTSPAHEAVAYCGRDEFDVDSTTFLRSFFQTLPTIRSSYHWGILLAMHSHALFLGHRGYSKIFHIDLLEAMEASAVPIPASVYQAVFETILLAPHSPDKYYSDTRLLTRPKRALPAYAWDREPADVSRPLHILRAYLGLAFEALERMETSGYEVSSERLFLSLHYAINYPTFLPFPSPALTSEHLSHETELTTASHQESTQGIPEKFNPSNLTTREQSLFQHHFLQSLDMLFPQPRPENLVLTMLRTYAYQGQWQNFWRVWRGLAQGGYSRTSEMYVIMWNGVADSQLRQMARLALSEWTPEMARERPVVSLQGQVLAAIRRCQVVAEAGQESHSSDNVERHDTSM